MLDITIDKRNIEKIMTESLLSRSYVQKENKVTITVQDIVS